ncbi:NUDIX hydrolase [Nonomuraea sp. SMC257]|uniref:NUDIX hydrolase n=1 Tax=Nonomuraea montanisoli TaxID=2741721 RepID=A0A7Y6IAB0_9ACTN|nr:NUDIX hydrolase [Nonomuraea montanisoli]NUW34544.1 NUDIX hydrolase [Nonomuraea montanisoli]
MSDNMTMRWYTALANVTSAVGGLILDQHQNVLLAEPRYKPTWVFVGGTVEADEAPTAALAREMSEELGALLAQRTPVGRLLVTDWVPRRPGWDRPMHHLVFDCGQLDVRNLASASVPARELTCVRFVTIRDARVLMEPHESRRLELALRAQRLGVHIYAEDGFPQGD